MIRLSTSSLTQLIEMCPLQYYYRYIEKIKVPPNTSLIRGNAIHIGCEHNFKYKMATGEDMEIVNLTSVVSDAFDKLSQGMSCWSGKWQEECDPKDIRWGDDDPGKIKDDCINVIRAWHEAVFPNYIPLAVEERFEIPYDSDGFTISGKIDLRCSTKHIDNILLDWKTTEKSWPANRCHKEFSPYVYSLGHMVLFDKLPAGFIFEVAAALKSGVKMESHLTKRSAEQIDRFFLYVIKPAFRMITEGIFPAALAGWTCSDKWCGYHADVCQAVKRAKSFAI